MYFGRTVNINISKFIRELLNSGRPYTGASQYSPDYASSSAYNDDDRLSFESRSLTAFGNYNGRESVMSTGGMSSTYSNRNGIYQNMPDPPPPPSHHAGLPYSGVGGRADPDRPNPFGPGGEVSSEADSVVQNFLRGSGRFVPPQQEQAYANLPPRFQDSKTSNVLHRPQQQQPPGRIENMASPVSPYNQVFSTIKVIRGVEYYGLML